MSNQQLLDQADYHNFSVIARSKATKQPLFMFIVAILFLQPFLSFGQANMSTQMDKKMAYDKTQEQKEKKLESKLREINDPEIRDILSDETSIFISPANFPASRRNDAQELLNKKIKERSDKIDSLYNNPENLFIKEEVIKDEKDILALQEVFGKINNYIKARKSAELVLRIKDLDRELLIDENGKLIDNGFQTMRVFSALRIYKDLNSPLTILATSADMIKDTHFLYLDLNVQYPVKVVWVDKKNHIALLAFNTKNPKANEIPFSPVKNYRYLNKRYLEDRDLLIHAGGSAIANETTLLGDVQDENLQLEKTAKDHLILKVANPLNNFTPRLLTYMFGEIKNKDWYLGAPLLLMDDGGSVLGLYVQRIEPKSEKEPLRLRIATPVIIAQALQDWQEQEQRKATINKYKEHLNNFINSLIR